MDCSSFGVRYQTLEADYRAGRISRSAAERDAAALEGEMTAARDSGQCSGAEFYWTLTSVIYFHTEMINRGAAEASEHTSTVYKVIAVGGLLALGAWWLLKK